MKSRLQLEAEIVELRYKLESLRESKKINIADEPSHQVQENYTSYDINDGIWDWNLITNGVHYSNHWKSTLGYENDEVKSNLDTFYELAHPDDRSFILGKIEDYLCGKDQIFEHEMRMRHKDGHYLYIITRIIQVTRDANNKPLRIIGTHVDITRQKKSEIFERRYNHILKMIAQGTQASEIYNEIAFIYEGRHTGIRCSMLELEGDTLLHGAAPSLPQEYCDNVHGLINGPNVGSCGTSTYTGKRVVVENIETDHKWEKIKNVALPYGMRSCWSEPIKSSTGQVLGAFGMYRDYPSIPNELESLDLTAAARLTSIVMERDQNQNRIQLLAYKDGLTGLSNRTHLFLNLKELIHQSKINNQKFSFLYIDLDNFKSVNDSLGHDVGDYLLKEVAQRLLSLGNDVCFVSRLGGDEFCIVLNKIIDVDNVSIIAQRALNTIAKTIKLSGRNFIPKCSIGIAQYPEDGNSLESILKAADIALYSAKNAGKNSYAFYNVELSKIAEYHFRVEQYLREAIEKKQLTLVYQPQIDIKTGHIVGVEALSRWTHSELGVVSPVEFIEMAERIGMIKQLTEWVMHEACTQGVKWQQSGFTDLRVAINISPTHLSDIDFLLLLKKEIELTGMYSQCLELEITESVVQTNHEDFSIFQSLKDLGVLLAIDDFGSGYSSFASLKHLRVDYIKIDKYFINDMLTDHKTNLLVGSMIEMGHNLGYKVIAEGVETVEQFNALKTLNCDIAQGFLFSKPVAAQVISELLNGPTTINMIA